MSDFSLSIREWYRQNYRKLPWRETTDPYKIWLSEVILQQTRVEQGLSYYLKFVKHYPTVNDLASASEQAVLNDWQGLGYYSRARNLRKTAQQIVAVHQGVFPDNYDELIQLKGIGPYTAAAISSFAFQEKKAVVDGNVYRVLSRYFLIDTPIDSSEGKKTFQALADELISTNSPGEHNQALMELGAMVCTPKTPNCANCPLSNSCLSHATKRQTEFPKKKSKTKVRDRYFAYLVNYWDNKLILQERLRKDVWQHLYEFPLIELRASEDISRIPKNYTLHFTCKHILSHQRIHAQFFIAKEKPGEIAQNQQIVSIEQLDKYPLPRLIDKYLEFLLDLHS